MYTVGKYASNVCICSWLKKSWHTWLLQFDQHTLNLHTVETKTCFNK